MSEIYNLIIKYKAEQQLYSLQNLMNYTLTEHEFATLIGKCKLYNYLPVKEKRELPLLTFGDTQISMIAKDYYQDKSFCRNADGSINLWNVYNLFTGANKQSYIDTFLNAFDFTNSVVKAIESRQSNWFLN